MMSGFGEIISLGVKFWSEDEAYFYSPEIELCPRREFLF